MEHLIELLLLALPAYFANASPVVIGGGEPLDLGIKIGGKRLLGKNKTIRGFLGGVIVGSLVGAIMSLFVNIPHFFYAAFLASLGTLVGDALGSFIKRQLSIKEGEQFWLDGSLFIVIAFVFAYPYYWRFYEWDSIILVILITQGLHMFFNWLAFKMGWKRVPW